MVKCMFFHGKDSKMSNKGGTYGQQQEKGRIIKNFSEEEKGLIYFFLGSVVLAFCVSYLLANGEPVEKIDAAIKIISFPFKLSVMFLVTYFGVMFAAILIFAVIGLGCVLFEGFVCFVYAMLLWVYGLMRKIALAIKVKL